MTEVPGLAGSDGWNTFVCRVDRGSEGGSNGGRTDCNSRFSVSSIVRNIEERFNKYKKSHRQVTVFETMKRVKLRQNR